MTSTGLRTEDRRVMSIVQKRGIVYIRVGARRVEIDPAYRLAKDYPERVHLLGFLRELGLLD